MKIKNTLLILENHVDKVILGLVSLISMYLLWVYIIGNPYGQEVKGRKLSPSKIDMAVKKDAERLYAQLDKLPDPMRYDKSFLSEYEKLLACSIDDISDAVALMTNPSAGDSEAQEARLYTLPIIPPLDGLKVASLRGGAEVPVDPVGPDRQYDEIATEQDDVDFITISSRLDISALYDEFQQRFAGPRLKTAWKDQRLARPVFARLELQRRVLQESGDWGQWERVQRTQVDAYKNLLEDLPLTLDESQLGVDALLSQYDRQEVQFDILQPEAYSFTISRLDWMPPEFLNDALEIMDKQEKQDSVEKQEQRRKSSTNTRERLRPTERRTSRRPARGADDFLGQGDNMERRTRTTAPKERDVDDVKKDFELELLKDSSDIATIREPMLIWAHDDSAVPGNTYQYRIRIGVFNPIAGRDWFEKEEERENFKDQLVLWSDYSEPTDEVFIPRRIYVFPMGVIAEKDSSGDIKGVQVEVAKYQQGRWWDYDFDVIPGEVIGYEVEDIQQEDGSQGETNPILSVTGDDSSGKDLEKIDFTSDVMLVGIEREAVWGSRLRPDVLFKMLYSDSRTDMRQMAIGKSDWDSDTRKIYAEIQKSMKQDVEKIKSTTVPEGMPDFMEMYLMP
jgi:hypothetical protein